MHGTVVSLGFSENDCNSLYIAQMIIDSDGKLLVKRRKLKATHMERTIFGDASGYGPKNVATTGVGRHVGALACREHMQPLLKVPLFGPIFHSLFPILGLAHTRSIRVITNM